MNTRRDFLTGLGKLAGGVAGAHLIGPAVLTQITLPFLESCTPTSVPLVPQTNNTPSEATVDVSDLSDGNPAKVIPGITGPDGFSIMITRISATDFRALSMRCTHANCPVDARLTQDKQIHCNCHGSTFSLDGAVILPPATVPLASYTAVYGPTANQVHVKIA